MGEFLTHILQADRVPERIESRRIAESLRSHRQLFRLGAQGPDPLFFHGCFPGNGKKKLVAVGRLLHNSRTGAFLSHGFRQLHPVSWTEDWEQLAAYLCGMVCHYFLDRILHPYVNAVENKWIWSDDGIPTPTTHGEVETMLDVILWKQSGRGSACRVRSLPLVVRTRHWPESVQNFWITALYDTYDIHVTEKEFLEMTRDFKRGERLLYDPRGIKTHLIHWVDGLTGGAFHPGKMPYPPKPIPGIDWTNDKRRSWFQPELPKVRRNESVEMLMEEAVHLAANAINGLFAVLLRGEGRLEDWLPDMSYNTNLPCKEEESKPN